MPAKSTPFSFAFARAAHADTDADALLQDCLQQLSSQPSGTLGFVYATEALAGQFDAVLAALKQTTGTDAWVGAVGYGICTAEAEIHQQPALVVMLADLPPDAFTLFKGDWNRIEAFRAQHQPWYGQRSVTLAQVHGSPGMENIEQLTEALAAELPSGFLAGGLASAQSGEYQFAAGEVESQGLSGVMLDLEQIPVQVRHTQGCHPIGPHRQIDEAFRNVLVKVDGMPALDALKQDMGELLSRNLDRSLATVLAGLMVEGSDTGDYLARHLVGVDPDRGLVGVGDWVRQGGSLQFCRRDPEAAQKDLEQMMEQLTRGLKQPPRGALYIACVGRGRHMFGDDGAEMAIIRRFLPEVPIAGFFANGEIYHQRLYGYTGVLTLFT